MSETILLFCCRSCLRGSENDRAYYDALGIEYPKSASIDDIKKAYKKKSLEIHPDKLRQRGIEATPELQAQFLKTKEAYEILADPRKRRLYDELGATGLKLIDDPTSVDPTEMLRNFQNNTADRWKVVVFIAFIFATILLLPILFSLKCDDRISAPWMAIWTPMWLVDAIALIVVCLSIVMSRGEKDEDEKHPEEVEKWYVQLLLLLQTSVFILIQFFVLLRLDNTVEWSWFTVFIPWYIYEALAIIEMLFPALAAVPEPDYEAYHEMPEGFDDSGSDDPEATKRVWLESKYYEALMHQFTARKDIVICALHIWFAIFLAVQLDGDVDWNWGLVMLPVWVYFAVHIFVWRYLLRMGKTMLEGIDIEAIQSGEAPFDPKTQVKMQVGIELVQASSSSFYGRIPHLLMALLLVSRLEVSRFSTFWILTPIFFFIFLCICFVGIGICCLSYTDPDQHNAAREDMYENAGAVPEQSSESKSDSSAHAKEPLITQAAPMPPTPPAADSNEKYGTFGTAAAAAETRAPAAPAEDSNDID
jgi:hypothetical protein